MLPAPKTVSVMAAPAVLLAVPPKLSVVPVPLRVIVRLALTVTEPLPRFRLLAVPPVGVLKAKFPPQLTGLLVLRVMGARLVLSSVPPLSASAPVPRAEVLLTAR